MMKKNISLTLLLLLVTGCSISTINDNSFDNIVNSILYQDNNLYNTSFDGYKLYLPRGTTVLEKRDYNLSVLINTTGLDRWCLLYLLNDRLSLLFKRV